jgi:hypothetical protein
MGKPTYGDFSFPSDFGFSGSGKKQKAQAGGRILQDESMQGRLPQNAAMAARREAGMARPMGAAMLNRERAGMARPMGATMSDRERIMMEAAKRAQRPQPDVSPDRARAKVMDQMQEMGGGQVARKHGGKMDKKMITKAVKKHASMPAAKAHKGLGAPVHKGKPKVD